MVDTFVTHEQNDEARLQPVPHESTKTGAASRIAVDPHPPRRAWQFMPTITGKLVVGLAITLGIVAFAIFGPMLTQDPRYSGNPALQPPSPEHWLGTTSLGYDVLAQLAHGASGSLFVGLIAGSIALFLSLIFGVLAGYIGGWTDEILSMLTNIALVIPGIPLMIVISSYLPGKSALLVALVLGVTSWAGLAVVLRTQARSLRNRDYVAAARVSGERVTRILSVEILPNLLPLIAAQFLFGVIFAILGEAGLSYLGLGPSGSITWGTMLNEAQSGQALSQGAWWWFLPPGLLIAFFGCGLSLINFSIDEVVNPRLRLEPANARRLRKARRAGRGVEAKQVAA